MSASGARLRRLRSRPPSSPPEPSRSAVRRLRPALAAALLSLPLLAGLSAGAAAQTAVECATANTDGSYPVPNDWALKPSGLAAGAQFRLLFVTSTQRDGTATDIATYNTYVQTRAKAGHSAIADSCGNRFKVVGSTSTVDARDNTGTTGTGVPIHWLTGSKLADNYADFYDGTWDSYSVKTESGGGLSGNVAVITGSNTDGTRHNAHFGHSAAIRNGVVQSGADPISAGTTPPSFTRYLFGLSPVFTVAAPPDATVSIVSGGSPLTGGYADEQGSSIVIKSVTLSASQSSAVPYRACFSSSFTTPSFALHRGVLALTLTNGCYDEPIPVGSTTGSSFTLWGTPDSTDEPDEVVTITVTDDPNTARPAGVAPINVSNTVTIRDDDPTVVTLARVGSGAVTEGGKVEFTVTLGRALVAGETVDVPLSISGTGVTTGDWSLGAKSGAANTGVGLRDAGTAAPKVRFSGAGARTATLELTPTNDGATEGAETFTVALGSNTAFDAAALGTDVGGGADPHGTANAFTVVVNDAVPNLLSISGPADADEGDSGTRDLTFTVTLDTAVTTVVVYEVCFTGTATIDTTQQNLNNIPAADYQAISSNSPRNSNCVNGAIGGRTTSNSDIGVKVKGDTDFEPDETVVATLSLTAPPEITLGTSVATHTIRNDDAAPPAPPLPPGAPEYSFWITGGPPIDEGGEAVFTVHAHPAPTAQMEVAIVVTAAPVRSNFLNFGDTGIRTVRFSAGSGTAVYRARTRGDDTDEPDGFVRARLHSNKATAGGRTYWQHSPKKSAEVRVWDDDAPLPQHRPPVVSVRTLPGRGTVDEGETAYFCYGIEGSGYPANHPSRFWVRYEAVSSSGRVLIEDAALGLGTATREMCLKRSTWGAAGETYTARVLPPSGPIFNEGRQIQPYAVGTATATVTVRGGTSPQVAATPPSVTISTDAASVTEGGEVTFTVTADAAPGIDIAVNLGAAEEMGEGLDYVGREQTGTVTLPADATSATWTVTVWSDERQRADGTVVARIKPGDGYTAGTPSTVTVALLDDDAPLAGPQTDPPAGDPAPTDPPPPTPAVDPALIADVRALAAQTHHGAAHVNRWRRVLMAFGEGSWPGLTPMTAAEAGENARRHSSPLWPRIAELLAARESTSEAESAPPGGVSARLLAEVADWAGETHLGADHMERWLRVLHTLEGVANDATIMLPAEARALVPLDPGRWGPVAEAIERLEARSFADALVD